MRAGEGGGSVRDDSPDGVSPPRRAGVGFGGAAVQPIHDHGRQEEPDQVPARSRGGRGGRTGGGRRLGPEPPGGGGAAKMEIGAGAASLRSGRRPCAPQPWRLLPGLRRRSAQTKGDLTRWAGGSGPAGGEGAALPGRRRGRPCAPRARPPLLPAPGPSLGSPSPPASCAAAAQLRSRPPREATRPGGAGRRWGPGPSSGSGKGWVGGRRGEVSSAGFLRNYGGSPAPVIAVSPFPALPSLAPRPSPRPSPLQAEETSEACRRRRLLGL